MKKKLGIILAILLCVVLVFTCVACKKDKKDPDPVDTPTSAISGVTTEQINAMEAKIGSYLDSWLATNAEEEGEVSNQSAALKKDLKAQDGFSFTDDKNKAVPPTFDVKFKDGTYTITVSWSKGAVTKSFTKEAKTVTYTHWAGKTSRTSDYDLIDSDTAASDTLDAIVKAMTATVNRVTGNAVTGKFGADTILGLEVLDNSYGLRFKANVDTDVAANNEIGIVLVDENKNELGGLYYDAAATAADSKIYLQYSSKGDDGKLVRENGKIVYSYKYINYADIFGFIEDFLPETKEKADDGVLPQDVEGLSDLLAGFGMNQGEIVTGVVDMLANAYEKEDGTYLIDINLGYVMSQVSEIISQFGITSDSIPFLKDLGLDLATMHGLLGHISISAKLADENTLTDFELAVNIPECVFYFTEDESKNAKKLSLPSISFAIYMNDFKFVTPNAKIAVIPEEAAEKAKYFSPTNVDLSGDIYINHIEDEDQGINSTFHFNFVTDINPLEIATQGYASTARAALKIMQSQGTTYNAETATNFLTISYEQADKLLCASGTAFGIDDGNTLYTFSMKDKTKDDIITELMKWLGMDSESDNWHGIQLDEEQLIKIVEEDKAYESAKALLNQTLTTNLLKYFVEKKNAEPAGETAEAAFSIGNIGDYFSAFKGIYEDFVKEGVIDFDLDEGYASINVTPAAINKVTKAINDTFGTNLPIDIKDPEKVGLEFNSEGYEDKCYIVVKYAGNQYELLFDNSVAKNFTITFTMTTKTNRVYTVEFKATDGVTTDSATKWTATVKFDIKDQTGAVVNHTEVTLSNFHGEWGNDNSDEVEALIPNATAKAAASPIFPSTNTPSPATSLVKGLMKVLNGEKVEPIAEEIGKFIIRQIV